MKVNQFGLFLTITSGVLLEIIVHLFPQLVPVEFLRNLSPSDRKALAMEKGLATFNTRTGEGMLYHHAPYEKIKGRDYLHIDSLGYRNPQEDKPTAYDLVLLGDSMIFAGEAKEDLGALYRKTGVSTLNLGMPGYAPQHYRDAYKKYIIGRGIKNRYTFVFLFVGNDFLDAAKYARALKKSGNWLAYADIPSKNYFQEALPWSVNIAMGVPDYISGRLAHPQRPVNLPYRTIQIGYLWTPPRVTQDSSSWLLVQPALNEIVTLSRTNGAIPVILLLPSPATLYSQYREDLKQWDEAYAVTAKTLADFGANKEVQFIDLNTFFRKAIAKDFIFPHEWDCHLNQLGVQQLFNHLQTIRPLTFIDEAIG